MSIAQIIRNLYRYGRRPALALKAFRALRDYQCVRSSSYFDVDWVARQIPGFDAKTTNPVFAVLLGNANPSPAFCCAEYRLLHQLRDCDPHPLVHYERIGKKQGYALSFREAELNGGKKLGICKHLLTTYKDCTMCFERAQTRLCKKSAIGGRIKVYFLVYDAAIFPGRSVFEKMLSDSIFEPCILVIPSFLWKDRVIRGMEKCFDELIEVYGQNNVILAKQDPDGMWRDYLFDADMVCYPCPYDLSDPHYNPHWAANRDILPFYFNYSYVVANFSLEMFRAANFCYFWRVFLESDGVSKEYQKYSWVKGANSAVVGYAKMDGLAKSDASTAKTGHIKTIIIALHHTVSQKTSSSLLSIAVILKHSEYFLSLPRKYPNIKFVFRPHPLLIPALEAPDVWGRDKTAAYFCALCKNKNVTISEKGSYFDLFRESDGLIEDCGSFLAEYFYTGKPHCYLVKTKESIGRFYTDFGRQCLSHCYLAHTESDITRFVEDVIINENDTMVDSRKSFQEKVMLNYPHASKAVLDHIKHYISRCG